MIDKFTGKYMRLARQIGIDQNPCFSRQIGVVIVKDNRILGTGYNGPPAGTPHCDSYDYLENYFWPQLTHDEKESFRIQFGVKSEQDTLDLFLDKYSGCKGCPRRLVKAGPGQRSELCSCQHAERNAITNAAQDLTDAVMYCWCGIPCIQCAGSIINAKIGGLHLIQDQDYQSIARYLLDRADIDIHEHDPMELLGIQNTVLAPVIRHLNAT